MESAVGLATIDGVKTFRSSVVTLMLLRLESSSADCDGVCLDNVVAIIQQQKFVFGFQDEHLTRPLLSKSMAIPEAERNAYHGDQGDSSQEETFHRSTLPRTAESAASRTLRRYRRGTSQPVKNISVPQGHGVTGKHH